MTVRNSSLNGNEGLDGLEDDQIIHTYPTFGREHVTDRREGCWCQPKVEFVEGGAIIIHEVEQ